MPACLQLLESSETAEEPTTFEVGAGDIVGNRLFEASCRRICCRTCCRRCSLCSLRLLLPCHYARSTAALRGPHIAWASWHSSELALPCLPCPACLPALSCPGLPRLQAFDEAVRGLAVGDYTRVKVGSSSWRQQAGDSWHVVQPAFITPRTALSPATEAAHPPTAVACRLRRRRRRRCCCLGVGVHAG